MGGGNLKNKRNLCVLILANLKSAVVVYKHFFHDKYQDEDEDDIYLVIIKI